MIEESDLVDILKRLAKKRPIFHSEADFQHAFAWEIHQRFNTIDIRLERRFEVVFGANNTADSQSVANSDIYVDIWLKTCYETIAIETKYTTKELKITLQNNNENFSLKDHFALDIRRYDFLLDIYRLERLKSASKIDKGYAIFLTNNSAYWDPKKTKNNTNDKEFRIHENRTIKANQFLQWAPNTSKGTMKGRERPLIFDKGYSFKWKSYSSNHDFKFKWKSDSRKYDFEFRYLLVEV